MTEHQNTAGTSVKGEQQELREKGKPQRALDERMGQEDDGSSNHPVTKQTGVKSGSNAGEDLTSGEG